MSKIFSAQYQRLNMAVPKTTNLSDKAQLIFVASCAKLGVDPNDLPDVSRLRDKYKPCTVAEYKLCIIRDAITDEREANWDDRGENKYGGWFWLNKPGFRFYDVTYVITFSDSYGGPRLCTFDENDQEFFMKECIALWADLMGGKLPE